MLMVFAGSAAHAASRDDLQRADVAKVNAQYRMASQGLGMPTKANERHAELIGLDGESRLQVLTHRQDSKGTQYYRYQQTFRGVPIFGEQVVVSEANGEVRNLFGRKVSNLSSELPQGQLLIGKARALSVAKSATGKQHRHYVRPMVSSVRTSLRPHHWGPPKLPHCDHQNILEPASLI